MIRFLHTSDWQLGMSRHFLDDEAQSRFTQARIDAIDRIGALAREHEARFVVVCGDVFESNQVERQTVVRALEAMGRIAVPVILLPGNHDPLDAASVYRSPTFVQRRPGNLIIADGIEPIAVPGVDDAVVIAAPWHGKHPLSDLVAETCASLTPEADGFRICLGHGIVDRLSPDPDNPALIGAEAAESALAEGRIHYLALGDRHSVTRVGETGAIWYSGAPEPTDYDETRPGYVLLVQIGPDGPPHVEELPVGTWSFRREQLTLLGDEDIHRLEALLGGITHKERAIVQLSLEGQVSVSGKAALDALLEDYADHFASLRLHRRTSDLAVVPGALEEDDLGLSGYAHRTWEALAERAQRPGPEGQAARDALALFYRLARTEGS
ncbi:MAG: metallophosphoesterase [Chromatiales bacterium]